MVNSMSNERIVPSKLVLSQAGVDVLAEREGNELTAYLDTRGILTIGIGHTSAAGPPKVYQGMTITEEQSHKIFRADNVRFRKEALPLVHAPLYQYEWDALCSFLFNLGTTQFAGSTALKRVNAKDYAGVPEAMILWNRPSEIIPRRRGEAHQFATGEYIARIT
jgi:lysozyme